MLGLSMSLIAPLIIMPTTWSALLRFQVIVPAAVMSLMTPLLRAMRLMRLIASQLSQLSLPEILKLLLRSWLWHLD